MYAELSGLSKKAINHAIKTNMQDELLTILKAFIYDVQSRFNPGNLLTDINNPIVIKHKGRPAKRLIANIEKGLHKEKRVLEDSSNVNVIEGQSDSYNLENSTNITKSQKCGKCSQYGHYAKTCQNVVNFV